MLRVRGGYRLAVGMVSTLMLAGCAAGKVRILVEVEQGSDKAVAAPPDTTQNKTTPPK